MPAPFANTPFNLADNRRDLVELVNDEIFAFFAAEMAAQGDLYQWYKYRYIDNNIGLSMIDREITNFIIRRFGSTRKILEVGAGVGQCTQFLALCGVDGIGLDSYGAHFEMMKRLSDRLNERFDCDIARHFKAACGFFPDDAAQYIDSKTIVLVPSVGCTLTPEQEVGVFDALVPADGVIIGVRAFFRLRDTEEERDLMVQEIQKRGFGDPEVVFAWNTISFGFMPDRIVYLPKIRP
jgi:hypothetical protein